ncbi:tyrosine-protein kinase CSK isoform X3 [Mus musculus]|uniref:tyrosine-protein kinase CSK isoform X3 n=1 Tax=Mus musculus TaxID=10090 RepID=UPI0003D734F8|nr:tyrosine-protein kinase CSK isoform X3 [Mus musculus]|eukprot:XP_011240961.1 PREDICTED: tyrosine-protein kinase CSK isoform X2 [Mus musculus]
MSAIQAAWPSGTECIAKYNFHGTAEQDLPFCKGDVLTIVAVTKDPNWYKAKNKVGREGIIPANYVQKREGVKAGTKLSLMPWFHGKITREQAERLLYPPETGLFLVRESTNYPGDYTLCVSCEGKVEHYRIMYHASKLSIDEEVYFENLMQLVEIRTQRFGSAKIPSSTHWRCLSDPDLTSSSTQNLMSGCVHCRQGPGGRHTGPCCFQHRLHPFQPGHIWHQRPIGSSELTLISGPPCP